MPDYRSFGTGAGCGYNYPDLILFSSISKYVVGLDVIGAFHRDGAVQTFRDIRHREVSIVLAAFFKTLLLRYRYRKYYDYLGRASGTRVDNRLYNLRSYDGSRIPFADNSFDVVVSNAVLEHIQNVDEVPCEAARVTKSEHILSSLAQLLQPLWRAFARGALCQTGHGVT